MNRDDFMKKLSEEFGGCHVTSSGDGSWVFNVAAQGEHRNLVKVNREWASENTVELAVAMLRGVPAGNVVLSRDGKVFDGTGAQYRPV